MSAAVILQYRSLVAKATPYTADMKTRKGVVRGRLAEPCRGHLNEVKMTERKTTACFSSGNRKGFLCRIYEAENRLPMQ